MLTKGRSNVSYKKSTSKNFLAERILPSKTIKRTSIHSGYGVTRLPFAIRLVFIVAPFKHTCGFRFDRLISLYFSATIVETSSTHNWPIAVWGLFANINSTCIKRNSLYLCRKLKPYYNKCTSAEFAHKNSSLKQQQRKRRGTLSSSFTGSKFYRFVIGLRLKTRISL